MVLQAAIRLNAWMSDLRLNAWALMKMGECLRLRKLWSEVILEQRESSGLRWELQANAGSRAKS